MTLSTTKPRVRWVSADESEIDVASDGRIHLAHDARVDIGFMAAPSAQIVVELLLSGDRTRSRGELGSGLRFFVVPQQANRTTLVFGESGPSGVQPVSFHPTVLSVSANGAEGVLAEGHFDARGPRDRGYFRIDGSHGTKLEVSLGPWWCGSSSGAAAINVAALLENGRSPGGGILILKVGPAEPAWVRVSAGIEDAQP